MTTFGNWFEAQAGRGDQVGEAARAWRDARGDRPRVSSVSAITRWLLADPDRVPQVPADQLEPVLVAAAGEYRGGNHQAASVPVTGQPDASVITMPGTPPQQPGQPAAGGPVFHQLSELFTQMNQVKAALTAQGELIARLLDWASSLDDRLDPLTTLLAEAMDDGPESRQLGNQLGVPAGPSGNGAADLAAMQQASHPAESPPGWVPGTGNTPPPPGWRLVCPQCSQLDGRHLPGCEGIAIPVPHQVPGQQASQPADGPAAFYGGHAVPEPDWAALAERGDPAASRAEFEDAGPEAWQQ